MAITEKLQEKHRILIIGILLAIMGIVAYYFLIVRAVEVGFWHPFYIPIALASLWWKRKGLAVAIFLIVLFGAGYVFAGLPFFTILNFIRAGSFLLVGYIIGLVSETRARAEEELQQMSKVFTDSNDPIIIEDMAGNIMNMNDEAERVYGWKREELLGRPINTIIPVEHHRGADELRARANRGEQVRGVERLRLNKSGRVIPILLTLSLLTGEDGKPVGMATIARDITERKRAEENLAASEEKYRGLVTNVRLGIFRHSPKVTGLILEANPAMEEITGYSREELLGMKMQDLYVLPEEREVLLEELAANGGKLTRELRWRKKDGSEIMVSVTKVAMSDETGDILYIDGILEDITEHKRAREAQDRLVGELDAKNRELDDFVYVVSHGLKAPLVSLGGFSSMLQKEFHDRLGKEGKHYLERIQANVARMDTLVRDMLAMARIGRVVGTIEKIDLLPLVQNVQEELATGLKEAGAEFVVQEPLPAVRADRGRLHEVLVNLIDNAVKFRSEERPLRIEVGCWEEEGFYRFYVADNGIGIDPRYREKIFVAFQQLDAGADGVGMGLALVKKIIEHHGGRIWVQGVKGEGATFHFTLPVKPPERNRNHEPTTH